ncbi:uncharacterized protein [Diadema antillarum]|uniref:uncharacterized protein n=1 Tax=Diadema antillarum TaxID=105358 RepID=UPI003A841A11
MASGDFQSVSQRMEDISQSLASDQGKGASQTLQENIQTFAKCNGWLQTLQQMQRGAIRVSADNNSSTSENDQAEDLNSKLVALEEELLTASMNHGVKQQIITSAQLCSRLLELLFPPADADAAPDVEDGAKAEEKEKRAWAGELVDRQRTLASDILAHHECCQTLQDKIDQKKKEIRDLQASNVELMTRLQSIEKQQQDGGSGTSSRSLQEQQEKLDNLISHITMERGILQGLVIGSGVNWAKDEHLRKVVIGLGKPLQLD